METKHGVLRSPSSRVIPSSLSAPRQVSVTHRPSDDRQWSPPSSPEHFQPITSTPARPKLHEDSSTSNSPHQMNNEEDGEERDVFFRPLPPQRQQQTRLLPILSPSYLPPPHNRTASFSHNHPSFPTSAAPLSRHHSYNLPPLPSSSRHPSLPMSYNTYQRHNSTSSTTQPQLSPYNSYTGVPLMAASGGRFPSSLAPLSPQSVVGPLPSPSSSPLPQILTRCVRGGGEGGGESELDAVLPLHNLKIFIGTWNMHEEKELPNSIDDFLLPLSQETAADLYAIGTQESTPNKNDWECLLQQTLGPQYVLIHSGALGCVYLCLLLRRDLIWYCTDVQSTSYATRPFTAIKTKGSVAIRLTLFGSPFLFITSHFTAGSSNIEDRNMDMHKTVNNLTFSGSKEKLLPSYFVFWFGDFNYRVELEREFVDGAIQEGELLSLLLNDQLTKEILAGNVFEGYSEQPITFPPSYKFDVNSYSYDTSELVRVPSWTDRILFFAEAGKNVGGCGYDICPSVLTSDHRPVYAIFMATLEHNKDIEGIPTGYNRDVYIKGLKKHKHKIRQQQQQHHKPPLIKPSTVVPSSNKTDTIPNRTRQQNTTTTSSVCIIL